MTRSANDHLEESLRSTTELVQKLLDEIRENSTSVAVMKEKFESLSENVATLSHIVRNSNGKGSMITRLALAEKEIEDLNEYLKEIKTHIEEKNIRTSELALNEKSEKRKEKRDKLVGQAKLLAIFLPGLSALIIELVKLFL
jgi:translation initiation factor 2B subunit (eIF-2B alpha/beta/delta family)